MELKDSVTTCAIKYTSAWQFSISDTSPKTAPLIRADVAEQAGESMFCLREQEPIRPFSCLFSGEDHSQ